MAGRTITVGSRGLTPGQSPAFANGGGLAARIGARWSASGSLFTASEFLGSFDVSDGFTIDPGPRTFGWGSPGGPAAAAVFSVFDASMALVCTATLAPSLQVPTIALVQPVVPAFSHLLLFAPPVADINLTAFSLTLAAL